MRLLRVLAPSMCVVALALVSWPNVAPSIAAAGHGGDPICRIYLDPHDKFTSVGAPVTRSQFGLRSSVNVSNITVNYTGFTTQARAAFQAAVDIWQQQVQSSVPIVIDATFADLNDPLLLGQAGSSLVNSFANQPRVNTFYPFPLANSLSGEDLGLFFNDPTVSHIGAEFNSTADWSFRTDGTTVQGQVDFESVVLHELGHGLGFFGSGFVSGGIGTIRSQDLPFVYDAFVQDSAGTSILSYPNSSTQLANALQSGALFWGGSNGVAAAGGPGQPPKPKLYAPGAFEPGSSYSHLDDATYPAGDINSLMTHAIGFAESIHTPGPIMIGMFRDMGWTTSAGAGACIFTLSPSTVAIGTGGGTRSVQLTTQAGCAWTATSNAAFLTVSGATSGTGSAMVTFNVQANPSASFRSGTLTVGGQTLTVNQSGSGPAVAIDRTSLIFGATTNFVTLVSKTSPQAVRLTQGSGAGTVSWIASSNRPWLVVNSPQGTSGTGSVLLTIDVQFAQGLTSTQTGAVTVSLTGAGNATSFSINVTLNMTNGTVSAAPFGSFDSPLNGTAGITGSVAVTGWALDDVEVAGVRIFRDAVAGEAGGAVFIGNATMVDGARPDVAAMHPTSPRNTRAGWGYLMLTNFLPNQGNGAVHLRAFVDDVEGHTTMLDGPTIICANASSNAPFGAIDTPEQGATVSGTINNFGWTLIRSATGAFADTPHGGSVTVWIDSQPVAAPSGWTSRPDISALFATDFSVPASAVAFMPLDTTTLTNGVHTIAWSVIATNGQGAGIGSRYFTVSNGGGIVLDPVTPGGAAATTQTPHLLELPRAAAMRFGSAATLDSEIGAARIDATPIRGRRGFSLDVPYRTYRVLDGIATVQSEELDRLELLVGCTAKSACAGYLRTPGGVAPLPIGSHLDPESGAFTWQPGVGFVGTYDFTFVTWQGGRAVSRRDLRIVLNPKGSGRVGAQVVIDIPAAGSVASAPILLAGWAADLDSDIDSGVDTVHVWAYPVVDNGTRHGDPIWIGVAAYGGSRPDVAAVYGERFKKSGYGIYIDELSPGTYDLATFAYSTVTGGFAPAKTVRVTIR